MTEANWQETKADYWKELPAPARPWPSEVAWFEKYALEKKKEGKLDVLILGSTVEFRSMLHKNGMNVHIVDFSEEFFHVLSKQPMEHKGEETFYEDNWLTMNLGKQFDLIFGDWVPGVLHTSQYDQFFQNIVNHLKDDGLFIGREALFPTEDTDLEKALERHYKEWEGKYSLYETTLPFLYCCKRNGENMCDLRDATIEIDKAKEKGLIQQKDYDFIMKAFSIETDEPSLSVMQKDDFEKKAQEFFQIEAIHYGNDPSAPWFPVYAFKKK